jgi:hypothetical protein
MAREITEVWVVRGAVGNVIAHVETEAEAAMWRFGGNTIERLPLLTPHDAAVLEAADALERQWEADNANAFCEAVRARRAANAGGEP